MKLAGVDGCRNGWLCVLRDRKDFSAFIAPNVIELLGKIASASVIAIDVPIGLTDSGSRQCDQLARKSLGTPRGSSVFPAPVRAALPAITYADACERHFRTDGRRVSCQAFAIFSKIREVDFALRQSPAWQAVVREVHPELCFARWQGRAMSHRKSRSAGRAERETLIDAHWPAVRLPLAQQLRGADYAPDDLNDALAALWSAERIHSGTAEPFPPLGPKDRFGLDMRIWA